MFSVSVLAMGLAILHFGVHVAHAETDRMGPLTGSPIATSAATPMMGLQSFLSSTVGRSVIVDRTGVLSQSAVSAFGIDDSGYYLTLKGGGTVRPNYVKSAYQGIASLRSQSKGASYRLQMESALNSYISRVTPDSRGGSVSAGASPDISSTLAAQSATPATLSFSGEEILYTDSNKNQFRGWVSAISNGKLQMSDGTLIDVRYVVAQ